MKKENWQKKDRGRRRKMAEVNKKMRKKMERCRKATGIKLGEERWRVK